MFDVDVFLDFQVLKGKTFTKIEVKKETKLK